MKHCTLPILLLMGVTSVIYSSKNHEPESNINDYRLSRIKRQITVRIPNYFDARHVWKKCNIGRPIQSNNCVSAALVTASAISDRICIASNGKYQPTVSAMDIIECCTSCGSCSPDHSAKNVWDFWVNEGLPTGSNIGEAKGCKPYTLTSAPSGNLPCNASCLDSYSSTPADSYAEEKLKHKGLSSYSISSNNARSMQEDIMKNGPIIVKMGWGNKFQTYKAGVYKEEPTWLDRHVKLIGWGREGDDDYWLGVGVKGTEWGMKGLFRILRGADTAKIESTEITAGTAPFLDPDLETINTNARKMDIAMVIESTIIDEKLQSAIQHTISLLTIAEETNYNLAFILYGSTAAVALDLQPYQSKDDILSKLPSVMGTTVSPGNNLADGVKKAHDTLKNNGRENALWIALLIVSADISVQDVMVEINKSKKDGVYIAVLGLDVLQSAQLHDMASNGMSVFTHHSAPEGYTESRVYYQLPFLIEIIAKETAICSECAVGMGHVHHVVLGACDQFYHCRRAGDPDPPKKQCPLYTLWDSNLLVCNWAYRVQCRNDPCRRDPTLKRYPDRHNCAKYWECMYQRTMISKCCDVGMEFDKDTLTCVTNANCKDFCYVRGRCYPDVHIKVSNDTVADTSYQKRHFTNSSVTVIADSDARNGHAALFEGHQILTMPYFANQYFGSYLQIFIRFRIDNDVVLPENVIEILLTNSGCDSLEASVFIGFSRSRRLVHASLITAAGKGDITVTVDTRSYIDVWLQYDGEVLVLATRDLDGELNPSYLELIGRIKRSKSAIQIGGAHVLPSSYTNFVGSIDEVWISKCQYEKLDV